MKNKVLIGSFVGLLLAGLGVIFFVGLKPDPKNLLYWVRAIGKSDGSAEAAQGKPEAQFLLGLALLRAHLVIQIDRVPTLSSIPLVGKRFFEKITYTLANDITQDKLAEAHQWIKKSADQGYAPAKEAEKLFLGRVIADTPEPPPP